MSEVREYDIDQAIEEARKGLLVQKHAPTPEEYYASHLRILKGLVAFYNELKEEQFPNNVIILNYVSDFHINNRGELEAMIRLMLVVTGLDAKLRVESTEDGLSVDYKMKVIS